MQTEQIHKIKEEIAAFGLPEYQSIPNVGLFLEQTVKYVNDFLPPLGLPLITNSMVSNYVKKKIIPNPVKKQYDREQIARVLFIALAKSVLSLEDIQTLLQVQEGKCSLPAAYEIFCQEMQDSLRRVFALEEVSGAGHEESEAFSESMSERELMHNITVTLAHKIYMDKYIKAYRACDRNNK